MTAATRIPWSLAVPVEVRCEYAQTNQGDYYGDIETCLHTESVFPDLFEQATGHRPPSTLHVPVSAYEGVAALGGKLVFPEAHQPMIRNLGRILQTPDDTDSLSVPDPWQSERFQAHLEIWQSLRCRFPDGSVGLSAGQEGPVTTAVLLRGSAFFLDCLLDPARAHRLLSICTDTYIAFTQAVRQVTQAPAEGSVGICDDHAGNLSPSMWNAFVLPYYERIYAGLGATGRSMHTELVRRSHLPLLGQLALDHINFGENQYIAVQDVVEELDVPFNWHIKSVSEMLQGTPASIHAAYKRAVANGAPEMCCELAVGTPAENIRAYLEVAHEYAR
jgi:uroporphyrinogen-III decarboxylase